MLNEGKWLTYKYRCFILRQGDCKSRSDRRQYGPHSCSERGLKKDVQGSF